MKKLILSAVLSFSMLNLMAQFAPINATWHFGLPDGNGLGVERYMKYIVKGDTLINQELYSVVAGVDEKDSLIPNLYFYVTQKNDTVFYYFQNIKRTLFTLNAKLKDTVEIDLYQGGSIDEKVQVLIYNIEWRKDNLLAADSLKRFMFEVLPGQGIHSGYGFFTEKIIGSNSSGLLVAIGHYPRIPEGSPYLRCYTDSNYQYKNKSVTKTCDFSSVGLESLYNTKNISIYPNPASDKLFFELNLKLTETYNLCMYNSLGQVIKQFSIKPAQNNTIDISDLTLGLYIIEISNDIASYRTKFVKQ